MTTQSDQSKRTQLSPDNNGRRLETAAGTETGLDSSKRRFLTGTGRVAGAAAAAGVVGLPALGALTSPEAQAAHVGVKDYWQRRGDSYRIRVEAAEAEWRLPVRKHSTNGGPSTPSSRPTMGRDFSPTAANP